MVQWDQEVDKKIVKKKRLTHHGMSIYILGEHLLSSTKILFYEAKQQRREGKIQFISRLETGISHQERRRRKSAKCERWW